MGSIDTPTPSEMGEMKIDNPEKAIDIKTIKKLTKIN